MKCFPNYIQKQHTCLLILWNNIYCCWLYNQYMFLEKHLENSKTYENKIHSKSQQPETNS